MSEGSLAISTNVDGFQIRELRSIEDYEACVALQEEIWGPGFRQQVPLPILKVAQRLGGVATGAFDEHGELHGFVFGLTGLENGALVHWSDMLAVRPVSRSRGLGAALKRKQFDHCAATGVRRIYWTFDPLVARNAYINFCKLGIRAVEYVPQMYGERRYSSRHAGLGTDRLLVAWPVMDRSDELYPPGAAKVESAPEIEIGSAGQALIPTDADEVRITVPHDIDAIQRASVAAAAEWRERTRAAFLAALGSGWHVVGFERDRLERGGAGGGAYILVRSKGATAGTG